MITITTGDILQADAEALVNTVNCVGIMGRGIALQFKKAYPENFKAYEAACQRGEVEPGRVFVHETGKLAGARYIINFPTKRHWRGSTRLDDIESGLRDLIVQLRRLGVRSVAVPPLGCGLGGRSWSEVQPLIERALSEVPEIDATVFEPDGAPQAEKMARSPEPPDMTPGRAAIVGLMHRYLRGALDPFITLLELHKLLYFLQESGASMRLRYVKGTYGPYAENLGHALNAIEGHLIIGYADGGDAPTKQLELLPGAVGDSERVLAQYPSAQARFDRVVDLVDGFETPFGLELLASVHWVATREGATDSAGAVRAMYAWNARKKRFTQRQIELALTHLRQKDWLPGRMAGADLSD